MIPDEVVDQVLAHADIVQIIGEHVKLKRVGSRFRGPCPFHQGTHDNFSVTPGAGYVCFVCGEKGTVFTFVQRQLGLDFVEAVKYVGARAGVEVRETSARRSEGRDPRDPLWEAHAAAAEYFRRVLWEETSAAPARGYLEDRGIERAVAERFGLGFAPREGAPMRQHLTALGYEDAALLECGLLVPREGEEPRARFRGRLMFPIYDVQGRTIAFGGRVIGEGEPKYLNSPESPLFSKGKTLYALNWAKQAIRRDERALVVEGYMDALRLHAAGIESVVAPLGTALTEEQASTLRRYTRSVYLLYDADKAGLKATFRSGDALLRQGVAVHVVTLPEGEDPDSFVRARGAAALEQQLGGAIDIFERKIQVLERAGWFADLRKRRVAIDRLIPTLRATADPLTRDLYLNRAGEVAGVSRETLERELATDAPRAVATGRPTGAAVAGEPAPVARAAPSRGDTPAPPRGRPRGDRRQPYATQAYAAERELVRVLLHARGFIEAAAERVGPDSFRDPVLRRIFSQLITLGAEASVQDLVEGLPEDVVAVLDELLGQDGGLDFPETIVEGTLNQFQRRELDVRLMELDRLLPLAADAEKDRMIEEKQRLMTELKALGSMRIKGFGRRDTPGRD